LATRRISKIHRLELVIVRRLDEPNWAPIVVYKMLSIDAAKKNSLMPTPLPARGSPDWRESSVLEYRRYLFFRRCCCELRIIRPDGTVRTVQSRGRAIFGETGKPLRMIGTAQDITERKRSEERIRELGAIVESSDDAILGKSLDGIIKSWNKGAEKIYGHAENEVIGQPISMLVPTDRSDEVPQILGRLARGETVNH
jgi:PAS domain-containing protein